MCKCTKHSFTPPNSVGEPAEGSPVKGNQYSILIINPSVYLTCCWRGRPHRTQMRFANAQILRPRHGMERCAHQCDVQIYTILEDSQT
jgi:hypothetical protein